MAQTIRFHLDEHVATAAVTGLRHRGVDVLTVTEAGLLGASDEDHLSRARTDGRVLFTQDDDFLRLHAAGIKHAGIVYAHHGTHVGVFFHGLMLIFQVFQPDDMADHVEYL